MAEVTIHPEAEAESEVALGWYLDQSPQAAERFEAAFQQAIQATPTLFPLCDDAHRFCLLRRFPYIVVYRLEGDAAKVVAVAHSKRRPSYWSGRA